MNVFMERMLNFQQITFTDFLITLILTTLLSMFISLVYRRCHRGASYSPNFHQTIILMGIIVSVIMLVIGSNIARAFSLVGALSIIRFRTAIKDPMDVTYLFFVMAIGMACGTQFFGIGIVTTLFVSGVIYVLNRSNFGSRQYAEYFLEIQFMTGSDPGSLMEDCLEKFTDSATCHRIETIMGGSLIEASYTLQLKTGITDKNFLDTLREVNGNNKIRFIFKAPGFEI